MKDLLERELNGNLTASEALELDRCRDDEVLRRRRAWASVASVIAEAPTLPPASGARIGRGVRQRLAVRDALVPSRSVRLLPWAALAGGVLVLALIATWTEPALEEPGTAAMSVTAEVATGERGGPVQIRVVDAPPDASDELIEVVF